MIAFPRFRVASPRALTAGVRIANRTSNANLVAGTALPLLVPAVDEDGNERAGIRFRKSRSRWPPTRAGTSANRPSARPASSSSLLGSSIAFPATRAAREAAKDPRRSIEERYRSQGDYLARVEQAADALVKAGYLLVDDEPRILQRAGDQWEILVVSR